ncbi:MAG: hypothetical protein J5802_04010 [Butyrivibrio sp.]|nr:hypothetical protein [Butyrivibrio sp.]
MQYCPKCKIKIRGNKMCCPMCQGSLKEVESAEEVTASFPTLKKKKMSHITIMKMTTFICAVLEIIFITIRIISDKPLPFLGPLGLGILGAWIAVLATIYLRNNILKVITWEAIVLIFAEIYIDKVTGFYGWSIDFFVPLTLMLLGVITFIIALATKLRLDEYIFYLLFDLIMAVMQIIFVTKGYTKNLWPTGISIMLYMILLAGVLIFRFRDLKKASEKMFNM